MKTNETVPKPVLFLQAQKLLLEVNLAKLAPLIMEKLSFWLPHFPSNVLEREFSPIQVIAPNSGFVSMKESPRSNPSFISAQMIIS